MPTLSLVDESDGAYGLLREQVELNHVDLADAKIVLAWEGEVKPNRDGQLVWGRCRKPSAVERLFSDHDLVVSLNAAVWAQLPTAARKALLDHELSHAGVTVDDEGVPRYHIRQHDLEEFTAVVQRHGLWRSTVEDFVNAALELQRAGEPEMPETAKATRSVKAAARG